MHQGLTSDGTGADGRAGGEVTHQPRAHSRCPAVTSTVGGATIRGSTIGHATCRRWSISAWALHVNRRGSGPCAQEEVHPTQQQAHGHHWCPGEVPSAWSAALAKGVAARVYIQARAQLVQGTRLGKAQARLQPLCSRQFLASRIQPPLFGQELGLHKVGLAAAGVVLQHHLHHALGLIHVATLRSLVNLMQGRFRRHRVQRHTQAQAQRHQAGHHASIHAIS